MDQTPERVYAAAADIARIEARIAELPTGAHVRLDLDDGSRLDGHVAERPVIQAYRLPDGAEGSNALLRLEDPQRVENDRWLWVDRIAGVEFLLPE